MYVESYTIWDAKIRDRRKKSHLALFYTLDLVQIRKETNSQYNLTQIKMTKIADNLNPHVYEKGSAREITTEERNEDVRDEIDEREIFDLIRNINDPEHPLTLEELRVVEEKNVLIDNKENLVRVYFTPTIPHCSMATLIGLSIRVQLLRSLPSRFKVTVEVSEGSHMSEHAVNKQLADKERVAAALENNNLVQIINQCIASN